MGYKMNEVRMYEAYITKRFLKENKAEVRKLFDCFCNQVGRNVVLSNIGKNHFYLKGGNGYELLKQVEPRKDELSQLVDPNDIEANKTEFFSVMNGDFDFQLIPDYEHGQTIRDIDQAVISVLKETVQEYFTPGHNSKENMNLKAFQFKMFPTEVDDEFSDEKEKIIAMSHTYVGNPQEVNLTNNVVSIKMVGAGYRDLTAAEIRTNSDFVDDRLYISADKIKSEKLNTVDFTPENGNGTDEYPFTIYANYTIPEFILYRLVFRVPMENQKEMPTRNMGGECSEQDVPLYLKSEMIDISVPRSDSVEIMIDSTMSPEKIGLPLFYPFGIPGWEYHFCENLNMIQENNLGISGSRWKKKKRILRGEEALKQLKVKYAGMPNFPLGENPTKDYFENAATGNAFEGFGKMYVHNMKALPISADAKAHVSGLIVKEITDMYRSKVPMGDGVKTSIEKLAKVGIDVLKLEVDVDGLKFQTGRLESEAEAECQGKVLAGNVIRLITPLPNAKRAILPMNAVVFKANATCKAQVKMVLRKLSICRAQSKQDAACNFDVGILSGTGAKVYCIVEYVDDWKATSMAEPKEILRNSYFTVQRVGKK